MPTTEAEAFILMRTLTSLMAAADTGHPASDLEAMSDHEPPKPGQLFARFGLLLAVASGFGLCAQFLVALSH